MSNLRQAAEQALEALEWSKPHADASITYEEAINALRAALAEPADTTYLQGWVLRQVLFDNGEPLAHCAPGVHGIGEKK